MAAKDSSSSHIKSQLHPRNKHREGYDFQLLAKSCPDLAPFLKPNLHQKISIEFFDPEAVKMLNKALLIHHYGVEYWDIPKNYLCPPIPGRADYIHHIADLLKSSRQGKGQNRIPTGKHVVGLDIGVGANCIYPILGNKEYGWSFIGSDIDEKAVALAQKIVAKNSFLQGQVDVRLQGKKQQFFAGILQENERIDVSMCNPPFHDSPEQARASSLRKLKNLTHKKVKNPTLNFGGQPNELWCEGGEAQFVERMIRESREFATACLWFSTLLSRQSHLEIVYKTLKEVGAATVKTIPMGQGNKISRIIAWTFLAPKQHHIWTQSRWR